MKKQKTVIMLEDIKENMLGEKHESLLDENKMLRELLMKHWQDSAIPLM